MSRITKTQGNYIPWIEVYAPMFWHIGLRTPLPRVKFDSIRTHVSRAAKQAVEKKATSQETSKTSYDVATEAQDQIARKTGRARSLFPKFMRRYAERINSAPVSHIASFLIVHELTAVVPLFGLWGTFYYLDYVPVGIPEVIIDEGSKFIRRMAERNDWQMVAHAEKGSRIILQGAAAYFMVKAILPLRLMFSLWAMPWFARRFVVPINSRIARFYKSRFSKVKK